MSTVSCVRVMFKAMIVIFVTNVFAHVACFRDAGKTAIFGNCGGSFRKYNCCLVMNDHMIAKFVANRCEYIE